MANPIDSPALDDSYVVAEEDPPVANHRKVGRRIGAAIILLSLTLSLAMGVGLKLPLILALLAGGLTLFVVMLAATPYLRFIDHGWWTRYEEFGNQLWGNALSQYLWHFWHWREDRQGRTLSSRRGRPGCSTRFIANNMGRMPSWCR